MLRYLSKNDNRRIVDDAAGQAQPEDKASTAPGEDASQKLNNGAEPEDVATTEQTRSDRR